MITLEEVKEYLRVDTEDENVVIESLLAAAKNLCKDVARLSDEAWETINAQEGNSSTKEVMKVAILYCLAYLYEHREKADHHALTLTLRSILFAIREGVV